MGRKNRPISRKQLNERQNLIIKVLRSKKDGIWINELYRNLKEEMAKETMLKELNELKKLGLVLERQVGTSKLVILSIYEKKRIHTAKNKLIFEVANGTILNRGYNVESPINSEIRIPLVISNPTKKVIGIGRIVANSQEKDYPIPIRIRELSTKKEIYSLRLEPQQTVYLELFADGLPPIKEKYIKISKNERRYVPLEATIEIYDSRLKVIKKIPIKLYVGYMQIN